MDPFPIYTLCIIYTPNSGLGIAIFDREKEQGRVRGIREGAEGAVREQRFLLLELGEALYNRSGGKN